MSKHHSLKILFPNDDEDIGFVQLGSPKQNAKPPSQSEQWISETDAILISWERGQGIPMHDTKPTTAFDLFLQCQTRIDVNDTAFCFVDFFNI